MAAAIQHAAGGAILGAASSPAAAEFTWRAVAAAAPRLLRLMHQRHLSSSAPRAIHTLLHRPSLPSSAAGGALRRPASATGASPRLFHSRPAGAIAGANKQMQSSMMGSTSMAGPSRHFSSQDNTKFTNQLQEEEAKMKRKKALAEALMNDLPTSHPGAKDHGVEIKGISHLFSLLDVADAAPTTSHATVDDSQVAELLSKVEKGKHALLIELLGDGPNREQKKADLVDTGRRLRNALAALDERRALQNLYAELRSLQQRVASAEKANKILSDQVAAGKKEVESANAVTNSIRGDVYRLETDVTSIKYDGKAAKRDMKVERLEQSVERLEQSVEKGRKVLEQSVERLEESVGKGRKEAEAAYGLALFIGSTGAVAAALAALNIF